MEQTYGEVCIQRDEWKTRWEKCLTIIERTEAERDKLKKNLEDVAQKLVDLRSEIECAKVIGRAGGLYIGKQELPNPDERGELYLFNSPQTHSTLAVWASDCTREKVATLLRASNASFGIADRGVLYLPKVSAEPPFGAPDSLESHSVESVPDNRETCAFCDQRFYDNEEHACPKR